MMGLKDTLGALAIAGLLLALVIAKSEARHQRKLAENWHSKFETEQAGRKADRTAYQAAQAEAEQRQQAENKRIADARASNEKEIMDDYEARLAAARAKLVRVRDEAAAAAQGPARHDAVPGATQTAERPDAAAADRGLSNAERLIATEQAIQLEALQRWVRDVVGVK